MAERKGEAKYGKQVSQDRAAVVDMEEMVSTVIRPGYNGTNLHRFQKKNTASRRRRGNGHGKSWMAASRSRRGGGRQGKRKTVGKGLGGTGYRANPIFVCWIINDDDIDIGRAYNHAAGLIASTLTYAAKGPRPNSERNREREGGAEGRWQESKRSDLPSRILLPCGFSNFPAAGSIRKLVPEN